MIQVLASRRMCCVRWRWTRIWWWRKWSFVGFTNAEKCDGKLCVRWNTFEKCVSDLEKFLPVRKLSVQISGSTPDQGIGKESESNEETIHLDKHVRACE